MCLLVHKEAIACGADLCFSADVLFIYFIFIPTLNLQDASDDQREILHGDQY